MPYYVGGKIMKRIVIALIVLVAVIALAGLGIRYLQSTRELTAEKPEPVVIGVPIQLDASALVYIADEQRYFADNGLNVTIKEYEAGLYAVDDLLDDKNDIAVATEFVFVGKVFQQKKICTIASLSKYQSHYLIGLKDRGIENLTTLKGKKIGYASGTSGEFYLSRFLELPGINMSDVTPVCVKPLQYVDAIDNGTVDAILAWEPYAGTIHERLGANAISWPAQSGQLGYYNAICRDDWTAQHPEIVKQFLRSIDRATEYTIYHPAEAKAIMKKRQNASDAYIGSIWSNTQYSLSLDESLITAMEDEARWMIHNNLTDVGKVPDFRDHFYLEGLKSVEPGSVNIIQ